MIAKSNIKEYQDNTRIVMRGNGYLYVRPHGLLRPYIANYTVTFPGTSMISTDYTVIPNGSATLLFSFDGKQISSGLFGPATKVNRVGDGANQQEVIFIVEFYPYGLHPFIQVCQSELKDTLLPLEVVAPMLHKRMREAFEQAEDITVLIASMDEIFIRYQQGYAINSELELSVAAIIASQGTASVRDLSSSVYYSERHLNRIFGAYIGVSVKSLSKLIRVNKTIKRLQFEHGNMAQIACQSGYYDEAHLIHEFKDVCHITPQAYLKKMSDYYNEIAKF